MSMCKTSRYTKTATPAMFSTKLTGNADFCHHAVTVEFRMNLQNK